jgi:hypothetical protein
VNFRNPIRAVLSYVPAMRVFAGVTIFLALALAGNASAGKADNPTITGIVGPGFSIRFVDDAGNRLTQIPPGTYTVVIKDMASEHNFHLTGPGGFDMSTDVDAVGTFTWTVNFQVGTYHYQCDPHATFMKGDLTVDPSAPLPGSAPPAPTTTTTAPPPPPPPPPPAVKLGATVGPGATITVKRGVRKLAAIKAGRVAITVSDRSTKDNFHLTGPGVNRLTSKAGRSTVTWRLTLKRGIYRYRSDATPSLKGSFRAT